MTHKSREELLAAAKKRQAQRKKDRDKVKELQKGLIPKIPGVPPWVTALARRPEMVDIASLAFSPRIPEALLIEYLSQPSTPAPMEMDRRIALMQGDTAEFLRLSGFEPPSGTVVPEFIRQGIRDFEFPKSSRKKRERSPKQMMNDEIQSVALTEVNKKARKKDGSFKKGWNQKKVMRLAQKECTKERERLGLCKRKTKRKRKSKRNPYDSRLGLTRRRT